MPAPDANRLALVERSFAAIGRGDVEALADCYTPDYVLELPYARPEPKRIEGRDTVGEYLRAALGVFRFELTITEVYPTTDPDRWVLEYVSEGHVVPTGKRYANRYVGIMTFRGDRIASTREFYDPTAALHALDPSS